MEDLQDMGAHYKNRADKLNILASEMEDPEEEIKVLEMLSHSSEDSQEVFAQQIDALKAKKGEGWERRLKTAKGFRQKAEHASQKANALSELSDTIFEGLNDAQPKKRKLIRQSHSFLPSLGEEEQ